MGRFRLVPRKQELTRMRIIIVTDYPNINGGAGKVALESAIALVPHVESVHVFTTIGEVPPELASQVSSNRTASL